jgi:hypothetical protein
MDPFEPERGERPRRQHPRFARAASFAADLRAPRRREDDRLLVSRAPAGDLEHDLGSVLAEALDRREAIGPARFAASGRAEEVEGDAARC